MKKIEMKAFTKILTIFSIIFAGFLAITALLGGMMLVADVNAPSVTLLQGTPFSSYLIPGLALTVIVGGSALFAFILLLRKSKFALLIATTAGTIVMFFEFIEKLVIGSPVGVAGFLQLFYFGLGTLMIVLSMGIWFLELQVQKG